MSTRDAGASAETFINAVRSGPRDKPLVVLLHAMSLDLTYWDAQFGELAETNDVLAFDWPGHGRSRSAAEAVTFDGLADLAARLVTDAGSGPAHVIGISMGSMVAQLLALRHPGLVRSLCLMGSACTLPEQARSAMRARAATALDTGMASVLPSATAHWFSPGFRSRRPDVVDRIEKTFLACDPVQYAAYWEMISALETRDRLGEIACPSLVVAGENDVSTPPSAARDIADRIPGGRAVVVEGAAHLLTIETPKAVNEHLASFLGDVRAER